jgi:putative lipoprotein
VQRTALISLAVVVAVFVSNCAKSPAQSPAPETQAKAVIRGTATYRERLALPPGAVFEASLEDVSRAGSAADVIGRTREESPPNPPIPFEISFDPTRILPKNTYVVRTRILVGSSLVFTTDTSHPVLTQGRGHEVSVLMRRTSVPVPAAPPPPEPARELTGTSWRLVRFQSSDDTTLTPDDRSKYTITFGAENRVRARVDCNRGSGTWKASGNQLEIGPLALTRAACPPGPLPDRFARDLGFVRSYTFRDDHLFLALMADGGIYEFEPHVEP